MSKRRFVRCGPHKLYLSRLDRTAGVTVWTGPGDTNDPDIILRRVVDGTTVKWTVSLTPTPPRDGEISFLLNCELCYYRAGIDQGPRRAAARLWDVISRVSQLTAGPDIDIVVTNLTGSHTEEKS